MKTRIIAIDYGDKRTGIAQYTSDVDIVMPLDVVDTSGVITYIEDLHHSSTIHHIVIGMPEPALGMKPHSRTNIEKFGLHLQQKIDIPIHYVDERFTSKISLNEIHTYKIKKKNKYTKHRLDASSACLILENYLRKTHSFS